MTDDTTTPETPSVPPRTWDEGTVPTALQLFEWIKAFGPEYDQAPAVAFFQGALDDAGRAANCVMRNHDQAEAQLRLLLPEIGPVRRMAGEASAEVNRLIQARPPTARPWTPNALTSTGGTRLSVKRSCNGCGRLLGDVTEAETDAAVAGAPLPDVRDECGCGR